MCILIHKPAGVTVEQEWLEDFYRTNDDGFGFMYAEGGTLHIMKKTGTVQQFVAAWNRVVDKECIVHLRMKTHGKIDYENTHPYPIITRKEGGPIWMAHNGVLRTGNSKDKDKSDTWHFINDFLRPLLKRDPHLLQEPAFCNLLEETIGDSNRFAFLDAAGRSTIIHRAEGVEWRDMWLSNTYAWSSEKAGFRSRYGGYGGYGWYDSEGYGYPSPADKKEEKYDPERCIYRHDRAKGWVKVAPEVPAPSNRTASDLFSALRFAGLDFAYDVLTMEAAGWLFQQRSQDILGIRGRHQQFCVAPHEEDTLIDCLI